MKIDINNDSYNREVTILIKCDNDSIHSFLHGDKYIDFPEHIELYKCGDLIAVIGKGSIK